MINNQTLAFKNANAQCKRILRPLKARSAPIEDWIREKINVDLYDNDDNLIESLSLEEQGQAQMLDVSIVECQVT